jgi:hypothetical protein
MSSLRRSALYKNGSRSCRQHFSSTEARRFDPGALRRRWARTRDRNPRGRSWSGAAHSRSARARCLDNTTRRRIPPPSIDFTSIFGVSLIQPTALPTPRALRSSRTPVQLTALAAPQTQVGSERSYRGKLVVLQFPQELTRQMVGETRIRTAVGGHHIAEALRDDDDRRPLVVQAVGLLRRRAGADPRPNPDRLANFAARSKAWRIPGEFVRPCRLRCGCNGRMRRHSFCMAPTPKDRAPIRQTSICARIRKSISSNDYGGQGEDVVEWALEHRNQGPHPGDRRR